MQKYSLAPRMASSLLTLLCVMTLIATPLFTFLLTSSPVHAAGTIQGSTYRDHNYNGTEDGTDAGVANITVTAYDSNNDVRGTTTTGSDGTYSLTATGTGPYRIEFTGIPSFLESGIWGTDSGTTVQFVPDGDSIGVNLALHNPADYCQANPSLALSCFENGANIGSDGKGFISFPYDASGASNESFYTPPAGDATIGEVGTVWGSAYQRSTQRMYLASFLKRHSGLIDSPSTVYVLDYGAGGVPVTNFDLQGITPANGGSAIDLGNVCRRSATDGNPDDTCGNAIDNELPSDNSLPSVDLDAFDKVGKISFGDIEIDEGGDTLWLVNLNQRALISVDVSNPSSLPGTVNQYSIAGLTGAPTCSSGEYRPWGLGFQDGLGYLGGVCTAESGGSESDLRAFVHTFDPANVPAGLTEVAAFDLDYNRERSWPDQQNVGSTAQHWNAWTATWPAVDSKDIYPQPIVSDIDFAADGSMILGLMDRWGNQTGPRNYTAESGSTTQFGTASAGDIIHLCNNNGTFVLEGETSNGFTCATNETASAQPSGITPVLADFETDDGPSGQGEYYPNDHRKGVHTEISLGGLASLKQAGTIASVVFDPWEDYDANGIHWYNTNDGITENAYEIVPTQLFPDIGSGTVPTIFGKAAGLGDLQLICDLAPIEIGNRVWVDTNGNGIQDAGEAPIEGVAVSLYDAAGTTEIATTVTNAQGEYYFNGSNVTGGLATGTTYQVRIDLDQTGQATNALAAYVPTQNDAASTIGDSNDDSRDSDGDTTIVDNFSIATITTGGAGVNDHTIDFGFVQAASIGDTVWFDTNADGIQDGDIAGAGGEDGVDAVTVNLYNDADELVDSTTTNTSGFYEFVSLTPGDYYVIFDLTTLPTGTVVSPQDVGGNVAADDLVDSDAAPDTGRTATTTLEPGENDPSWDMGINQLAAIGNFVWFDVNGNGIQDAGEPGVDGVTVELFDANDASQGTMPTAGGGFYEFPELVPGSYNVRFTLPDGTSWTQTGAGSDDINDSDAVPNADPATAQTEATVLDAGENDDTWDAGLIVEAAIELEKQVQDPANANAWVDADTTAVIYPVGAQAKYRFIITNPGPSALTNVILDDPTLGLSGCPIALGVDLSSVGGVLNPTESITVEPADCLSPALTDSGFTNLAVVSGAPSRSDGTPIETALGLTPGTIPAVTANDPAVVGTTPLAAIGDTVWFDQNANGILDTDELGIKDVAVALLNSAGAVEATDTTDENGNYLFPGLTPGSYAVRFTLPNGATWTVQDAGGNTTTSDTTDSDVDSTTGETIPTSLDANETDLSWDAGVVIAPAIELEKQVQDPADATLWFDADTTPVVYQVGTQAKYRFVMTNTGTTALTSVVLNDPTPGVSGCPSNLSVDLTDAALSNGNGVFDIGEAITLEPANCLSPVLGANGFLNNAAVTGVPSQDDGTPLESALGLPAGTIPPVSDSDPAAVGNIEVSAIGDKVWLDSNADGIQDDGENGLAGVTVELYDSSGNRIDTTTTDITGMYLFAGLLPGDYSVTFIAPAGYAISPQNAGTDDAVDSDADPTTGSTGTPTTLDPGETDPSWDAGLYMIASLGDTVWLDSNSNGVQDDIEPGVADVTVQLLQPGNQTPVATTTTDVNGKYSFTNLLPGDYLIRVVAPDGYTITAIDAGANNLLDSDVDPATGESIVTTLVQGENDPTWDAGLVSTTGVASLGSYVWLDQNADGIQDESEQGLSGVTVVLYDADGTLVDTTSTDATGEYLFSDLTPGSYYVQFGRPNDTQYFFSPPGETSLDLDSDADTTNGRTTVTELVAGENDMTWDAGIYAPPLLSIAKSVNQPTIQPGQPVNYTLTYRNDGLSTAENAVITEVVPQYTTFSAAESSSGWSCQGDQVVANTICTYSIGDIPPQTEGNITLSFVVVANQLLPNDVTVIQNEAFISDDGRNGVGIAGQSSGVVTVPVTRPTALDADQEPNNSQRFRPRIYVPFVR